MQQLRFYSSQWLTLNVSGDNLTHHQEYLSVLVLVGKFRLLGVYEFNICGSVHHAL